MQTDLVAYYAARAKEYEKIYDKPERQADLTLLSTQLQDLFRGRDLLEIACGTGWWTRHLAQSARSVLATDINEPVLDIARALNDPAAPAVFQQDDLFNSHIDQHFEALFGGFIWSHIRLEQLDDFLARCRRWLAPGGRLVLADNRFVPGSNIPVSHTDAGGNTYQTRRLDDSSTHLVLKNFPEPDFLKTKLAPYCQRVELHLLEFYWLAIAEI
ncbi:MAG: class I SAM-dependent methyltransferase [Saprospiraceae bacterium]|nr:class I SAM-dependent methyltransferase [Saprospiraceae bacterium]